MSKTQNKTFGRIEIIYKTLDEITPYENNPRKNDDAVKGVAKSIKRFGFRVPIVIDEKNVIVCGHTRYKAAQKLGLEEIPCVSAKDLTPAQIKAFRLADNKTAEAAEWDLTFLKDELAALEDLGFDMDDMADFGFDIENLRGGDDDLVAIQDVVPTPEEVPPRTHTGELYKLGAHRLICGDCTEADTLKRLLGNKKADAVITDPPYNVDYTGKTEKALKIDNDAMDNAEFKAFLTAAFGVVNKALKQGGAFYIWHASRTQREFEDALEENGLTVRQQLIWNKNVMVLGRQDYQWKHEPCFYGWKDGAPHYFIDDRTQTTVFEDETPAEFNKMKKAELVALLEKIYSDHISATVINEKKPARSDLHPTSKPVPLIARLIKNSTKQKQSVLDIFGGSGTTLIAAEQLNRVCYMAEIDPRYCDVIIQRWEALTGKKAELLSAE